MGTVVTVALLLSALISVIQCLPYALMGRYPFCDKLYESNMFVYILVHFAVSPHICNFNDVVLNLSFNYVCHVFLYLCTICVPFLRAFDFISSKK